MSLDVKHSTKKPNYFAYIKSKKWQAKRKEALEFHGKSCAKCGSSASLEVHHLTYARLGIEEMSDLQILCETCHKQVHESGFEQSKLVTTKEQRKAKNKAKRRRKIKSLAAQQKSDMKNGHW